MRSSSERWSVAANGTIGELRLRIPRLGYAVSVFTIPAVRFAFLSLYTARNYRNVVGRPVAVVDWHRSALNTPRDRSPNDLEHLGPKR